jgi:Spy/CpxP family protein refolding chaperone
MSYGVQSAGLFGTTSIDGSASTSLRQFSNLDLTEDQRTQIRSIFKNAKAEGLTQDQVQQEINSILSPSQLATLQSNSSSEASNTTTASSQSTQANPFTDPNGPFANLDLTASQQTQVSQILSTARSEGLSFDQANAQISSLLTTAQQTAFESDLTNIPSPSADGSESSGSGSSTSDVTAESVQQQIAAAAALILQQIEQDVNNQSNSGSSSSTQAAQTTSNPFADPNGPFANLNLTADQQSQIAQILSGAQSQGLSPDQVNSQINAILTPTQQTTFTSDLANLPPPPAASGATGSSGTSISVASLQQQIEAAAEAILSQIEQGASSSSQSTSSQASSSGTTVNPFTDPNGPFANLNLTPDQQSEISQILSAAQSQGLTPDQVNAQIGAILSTAQQGTFTSDLASLPLPPPNGSSSGASTASASVSGQSQAGGDGTSALSSNSTESQIQQQIAAAESLVLQQIQFDLGYAKT